MNKHMQAYNDKVKILDEGFRGDIPVALIERTNNSVSEYMSVFFYQIKQNEMEWSYGFNYGNDRMKAEKEFKKIIESTNVSKIFNQKMKINEIKTDTTTIRYKQSVFADLQIRENPDEAFDNAIKRGMKNPDDWMYMYSDRGRDYFKHHVTRKYTSYPQFGFFERLQNKTKRRKERSR